MFNRLAKFLAFWGSILMIGLVVTGLIIIPVVFLMSRDLPDYNQLVDYDPPTISRIYASDATLMSELAEERRVFKKINEIPDIVKKAFLAAEDHNFYSHQGIDVTSIIRAVFQNIINITQDKNPVGGSTITQQVVKNFLLTNERTIARKVKEAILAYRISQVYSKDRILELYLNQIYLGNGAYGVAMAGINYFNKDLQDLTIEEVALLAAMPKAPSNLSPTRNMDRAKIRRNWVIDRMLEENFITKSQASIAKETPIVLSTRWDKAILDSGYYNESVRLDLVEHFGHEYVYKEGLTVFTNLSKELQKYADDSLREGLIAYDKRHGYRGVIGRVTNLENYREELKTFIEPAAIGAWQLAVVLSVKDVVATVGIKGDKEIKVSLPLANMKWARKSLKDNAIGPEVKMVKSVLTPGDVILVSVKGDQASLEQIPEVNGALVVIEPKSGKVLALAGGYSFKESKYNRATNAKRQPGSAFKPFVYLTALENGYHTTTMIDDLPISIPQGPRQPAWTPKNFDGKFMGPITLRTAIEKSRNAATVRLISSIGVDNVANTAFRFGVYDKMPPLHYSMALGAVETTPLRITAAFASFASNGMLIHPKLIDRVEDRKGNLIYSSEDIECTLCGITQDNDITNDQVPEVLYRSKIITDPVVNYQMVSLLEGVVKHGTGARAKAINKTVAVKTGTSNESFDTWAIGFSPDIVCGVFIGFDNPKTLGKREQGATVALPVFVNFMQKALANLPSKEFVMPSSSDSSEDANKVTGEPITELQKKKIMSDILIDNDEASDVDINELDQ